MTGDTSDDIFTLLDKLAYLLRREGTIEQAELIADFKINILEARRAPLRGKLDDP